MDPMMNQNEGTGGGMGQMPTEEKSWGGIVAIVIVIALLLIGGLYLWGKEVNETRTMETATQEEIETADLEEDLNIDDLDLDLDLNLDI